MKTKLKEKTQSVEKLRNDVSDRDIRMSKYISYKREYEELNLLSKVQAEELESLKKQLEYKRNEIAALVNKIQDLKFKLDDAKL